METADELLTPLLCRKCNINYTCMRRKLSDMTIKFKILNIPATSYVDELIIVSVIMHSNRGEACEISTKESEIVKP